MEICKKESCTGCGMCTNICSHDAISMVPDQRGFLYPQIDKDKCVLCNLCVKMCPSLNLTDAISNVKEVYAGWSKDKSIRQRSTSGGIFNLLAGKVLSGEGYVAGVRWTESFHVSHDLISDTEQLVLFNGSKYVQSHTNEIYSQVKEKLKVGKQVLFSGTPCQNHGLRCFLNKEYDNLYQIDLVCHGVPSDDILKRYLKEISERRKGRIWQIRFRHKAPYWNYCNVTINFDDGYEYSVPTVDDPYFILFNIGFSLRESCRNCKYTNLERHSDITLADFWGYKPNNFKMRNYDKGTSCILINSEKGEKLFHTILQDVVCEKSDIEKAKKANKSLYSPYSPSKELLTAFWEDYDAGMRIDDLCAKYVPTRFKKPSLLWIRILKYRYSWILKK